MILFYTTRNITGSFSTGLIVNLKILEKEVDDLGVNLLGESYAKLDMLSNLKTEKGKNFIESVTGLKIRKQLNLFGEFYTKKAVNMASWKEIYDSLDVSSLKDYKSLHIFGGIHFPQSNLSRHHKRRGIFPNDRGQIKFKQAALHIINILAIHKAHVEFDIPLHEFSYDCDELCSGLFDVKQNPLNYHLYHVYDMPQYGMKRLDSLQYYLASLPKTDVTKTFELTFGYTVYDMGNRSHYIEFVNEMANKFGSSNIFIKNVITGEDNSIDRFSYLELISKSKYTLILPSYDNDCFSAYRFIEAVHNDCIPLIHPDCRIDQMEESFDMDIKFLVRTEAFPETERVNALIYLKNKLGVK